MNGDVITGNGVEGDDHAESAATANTASGERRSSIGTLQTMLKKVSQSPFHNQYKTLVSSSSDSSGLSVNESQTTQNRVQESLYSSPQNGVDGDLTRRNPFYAYYLESGSKRCVKQDERKETSEEAHLHVPPPEFQSSPLELQPEINTAENGDELSGSQKDPFQTLAHNRMQNILQTSTVGQNTSANGYFHNVTLNSPELFKANPAQPQNLGDNLQSKNSDPFKAEVGDLLQKREDLLCAKPIKEGDVFHKSSSSFVDKQDLSPEEKLFGMSSIKNLDVFSPSSTNPVDPFPNPIRRDLFQDISSLDDPFSTTPKQYDPFQDVSKGTPDILQPFPLKTNSRDVFARTPNAAASKATHSALTVHSPSEMKLDMSSPPDLFQATPSLPAIQPESFNMPDDVVLTTPKGTKHNILQPTPFVRARNLAMSPHHSPTEMSHVPTFKRPPKPLPRSRPPKMEMSPTLEKPPTPAKLVVSEPPVPKTSPKLVPRLPPKPVIHRKPKTPDNKPVEPDNYVVFEDILLLGQEQCVEDWPEDSPELSPHFKPSGTLRLRRESTKRAESGGSGEDQDASGSLRKKKERKSRLSLPSLRGSKVKFPDDTKGRIGMLPSRTLSKEYFSETNLSTGDGEDGEQNGMEYQKKTVKTKVNQLLRKTSTSSPVLEKKHMNGHLPQESKDDGIKKNSMQRSEEGTVLDNTTGEEEGVSTHGEKGKKKMKIGFVPHRGFTITLEKNDDKLKGVQGSRPRVSSKELQDEVFSPSIKKSQAAVMDVEHMEKAHGLSSPGLNGDIYGVEDCKPKKQGKLKLPRFRHSSQEYMLDRSSPQNKKKSFSVEELNDELTWMEDGKLKKPKHKGPSKCNSKTIYNTAGQSEQDGFEDELAGKEVKSPAEMYDTEDDEADTCKPTKSSKPKGIKHKTKSKAALLEVEDSPGATSSDYLSEAAKAEWLAAQRDERTIAGLEDEDEDGDTDSLMEWWYTVEQWDEVPSDDEDIINKDESKSFTILADKVQRGLCVFNKVFTERAEVLWQSIITLNTAADDINDFHHKARIAGITGGTTTAVGGATAIAGLALAPFTFGASLVVTAVGVGVAAAGGIASASAAISDNVNNMNDRKKVETVLREYEVNLLDIGKILHFVNQGLYKLRGHPFLRSGTQHYSEDWEIRKAVQMIGLVDLSVMRGTEATDQAVASIQGLFKGMDRYFIKDTRELKKGCKKEIVGQIKAVASVLNDAVMELNGIREEIQEAIGQV